MNKLREEFCKETNTPMGLDNEFDYIRWLESKLEALSQHDVSGSVCVHKNQERIDYGTNICKDCRRLINTLKQTDH